MYKNYTHISESGRGWLVGKYGNKQSREQMMNNTMSGMIGETAKSKRIFSKRHVCLIGSQVAIAALVILLAGCASRLALLAGLCGLATLTLMVAFAAFFRAYVADLATHHASSQFARRTGDPGMGGKR